MPKTMDTDNCFYLNVIGQIESCYFPIGFNGSKLFCRYDIGAGVDWEIVSGMTSGVTQSASIGARMEEIIFNMPIEFMFKSTNPFGWPQIVFSLYRTNWWGTESSQGYARIHVPLSGRKTCIRAPIIIPKSTNIWSSLVNWFSHQSPELRDPKILFDSNKTKGLSVGSYGEVIVSIQAISRGAQQLSLDWGQ